MRYIYKNILEISGFKSVDNPLFNVEIIQNSLGNRTLPAQNIVEITLRNSQSSGSVCLALVLKNEAPQ